MNPITIGCDPEVFVQDKNGIIHSIIGKLGGTKQKGREWAPGYSVLEDNVAAEFNTPPATTAEEFHTHIQKSLEYINSHVGEMGLSIARKVASTSMDPKQMTDPDAWVFGCDPDFNAYTGLPNPKPSADDIFLRSCGGHIHLGFGAASKSRVQNIIRTCDLYIGVPSVLLDDDTRRRELYGNPGAFRYKPYGAEYRSPSNFWVFEEGLTKWIFEQAQIAVKQGMGAHLPADGEIAKNVQNCIISGDKDMAKDLMKRFGIKGA